MITIYCDGACSGNGKENAKGGWAYVLLFDDNRIITGKEYVPNTTNQRMELAAAIGGITRVLEITPNDKIIVYTDSAYLHNCYTQKWWVNWQKNGWKNAKKQPVANRDLWEQLIPYFQEDNITFTKVKGHAGDFYNEMVDKLAVEARLQGEKND